MLLTRHKKFALTKRLHVVCAIGDRRFDWVTKLPDDNLCEFKRKRKSRKSKLHMNFIFYCTVSTKLSLFVINLLLVMAGRFFSTLRNDLSHREERRKDVNTSYQRLNQKKNEYLAANFLAKTGYRLSWTIDEGIMITGSRGRMARQDPRLDFQKL